MTQVRRTNKGTQESWQGLNAANLVKRQYGYLYKEQMKALFKSMKRWWLSELEVSQEQYDQVCASALEEFEEYHSIAHWKIMTAKKPV